MSIFDALYEWWYVPILVIAVLVLLRAGYELWDEAEQARKKAQAQLQEAEQEREALGAKLKETEQERDELRQENKELIVEAKKPTWRPPTAEEWLKTPLTLIEGRTYRNERVPLDGFYYVDCTFINPTFVFEGEKRFYFKNPTIEGTVNLDARTPPLQALLNLLRSGDALHPETTHKYEFDD